MRTISTIRLLVLVLVLSNCKQSDTEVDPGSDVNPKSGYVTGKVVNTEDKPIAGAKVYIDNTIYYNSGASVSSDGSGNYKIKIPAGSVFKAYAEIEKEYNGAYFKIELHPSSTDAFSDDERVVRNFVWKLSGEKTSIRNTFYGGEVQLHPNPNSKEYIPVEEVEFTFAPVGPLIDGSTGKTLVRQSSAPRTIFYSKIMDVPIGRYRITAKHKPTGRTLLVQDGSDYEKPYATSVTLDFFGQDSPVSCDHCMKVDYTSPE